MSRRRGGLVVGGMTCLALLAWSWLDEGAPVQVSVPVGATLSDVADSLAARGVVRWQSLFKLQARVLRAERGLRAGSYALRTGSSSLSVLRTLKRGEVMTVAVTIPEGFRLTQMAPRIAAVTGVRADSVMGILEQPRLAEQLGAPGESLEGYLFPDTYRFALGVSVASVADAMLDRYERAWTPERRERLGSLGLTEHQLVTLASIVQAEARLQEEMPRIAGVYHNRLERGWRLQADPTVLYALGGYRERLLYAAIDSVQDHPYNTYGRAGLPPGPIGAPGEAAIDAALNPTGDYLYFVAWPDGSHVFTRSLAEHNRAKASAQRARNGSAS
jgi:UPF0755 protein